MWRSGGGDFVPVSEVDEITENCTLSEDEQYYLRRIQELEDELDLYKPLFICLSVLVGCVLLFLILLVLPQRRRQKFKELLMVETREREEHERQEQVRIDMDNFILKARDGGGGKDEEEEDESDSGVAATGGSSSKSDTNSTRSSVIRRKEMRRRIEEERSRTLSEGDDAADGGVPSSSSSPNRRPRSVSEVMINARALPYYGGYSTQESDREEDGGGGLTLTAVHVRKDTVDAMANYGTVESPSSRSPSSFSDLYDVQPPRPPQQQQPRRPPPPPTLTLTRPSDDQGQPRSP